MDCQRTCEHMQEALAVIHEMTGKRFLYHDNLYKFVHEYGLDMLRQVYQHEKGQNHQPDFMHPGRLLSPKRIGKIVAYLQRTPLRERAKDYLRNQGVVYLKTRDIDEVIRKGVV
jgi:hypothetical protein